MTIWYLIGTVIVVGLAVMAIVGTGGVAGSVPLIWVGRFLPSISALIACVAFCLIAIRARLGIMAPVYFCLPLLALSALMVWPHVVPTRNSNVYLMLFTVYPVLTVFPAMALWHLATTLKRKVR